MLFDRYNKQFDAGHLDQREISQRLQNAGDWVLYREDGAPAAIRRLDETRLFYAGIQKFSRTEISIVGAVIARRGGGCICQSQVEIEADRFGSILMVKIDSKIGDDTGNVTRIYKRKSYDRDWQFCMYQTKDRTIGGNEVRAVVSKHMRNLIRNRLHSGAHEYPPQRLIQHLASLREPSNRRSAGIAVGKTPVFVNGGPILPSSVLQEFVDITSNKQRNEIEVVDKLEEFTANCLFLFEKNSDIE